MNESRNVLSGCSSPSEQRSRRRRGFCFSFQEKRKRPIVGAREQAFEALEHPFFHDLM
jgi:hypothetical protein